MFMRVAAKDFGAVPLVELRLVLGTLLEINDDDQELAFDPDDPEARTQALYGYLGGLLDEIVDAQLEALS